MTVFNFEFVKHGRGELLYLTDEKQLYYCHEKRSKEITFKCSNKKCKYRVVIKNEVCTRYGSTPIHNHSENAELKYTKLTVFNKILRIQEDALKENKQISIRKLFGELNNANAVKLSYEKCKRSLYRHLREGKRNFEISNRNNTNILRVITTVSPTFSIVSSNNPNTSTTISQYFSELSFPNSQQDHNSASIAAFNQTISLNDAAHKISISSDILIKPVKSTVGEHVQQLPISSVNDLPKSDDVQIPLKNNKLDLLITIPNVPSEVLHNVQPSASPVSCPLEKTNNKIPVVVLHDILQNTAYKDMLTKNLPKINIPTKSDFNTCTPFEETREKWQEISITSNNNQPRSLAITSNEKSYLATSNKYNCEPSTSKEQPSIQKEKHIKTPSVLNILSEEEMLLQLNKSIETIFLPEHVKEEEETLPTLRTEDTHDVNGTVCVICDFRQVNVIIKKYCGHLFCVHCLHTSRSIKKCEMEQDQKSVEEIKLAIESMKCARCFAIIGELHFAFHPKINHSPFHFLNAEMCRKCGIRAINSIFYPCGHLFCNICYNEEYDNLITGLSFDFKSKRIINRETERLGIRCFECFKGVESIQRAYL